MAVARKLSPERLEFIGDLITTAIEGGIGYWSQTSQYQYLYDGEVKVCVGEREGDEPRAVIHVINDYETGYEEEGLVLDVAAITRGLNLIRTGGCRLNDRMRKAIMQADRANDAIQLDAFDADAVVQAGLLGEIVYG